MDEHPFIALVERHSAAINGVCRSFCAVKEDREDLRQEILLHLWQGWKNYRPEQRPITWIYRVALNTAISWRRHRQKQLETMPMYDFDTPDDSALREQTAHLRELVAALPKDDRRMIRLYLDGFTSEEIGSLLDMTRTNVTTRMSRIREKIRKLDRQ